MDGTDSATFRKMHDSLVDAKKKKMDAARDAERQLALAKQLEEEQALEELRKQQQNGGKRNFWSMSMKDKIRNWKGGNDFDMSTYSGMIKILQDVKDKKCQMPPNFPTLD